MRKHIVFILGSYFPNPSQNGVCAKNIIEELKSDYDITVICENKDQIKDKHIFSDINVIYISNCLMKISHLIQKLSNSKHICKRFFSILLKQFLRIYRILYSSVSFLSFNKSLFKKSLHNLNQLDKIQKVDVIIGVCYPFYSLVAGYKFKKKHKGVIFITYILDVYTSNKLHRRVPLFNIFWRYIDRKMENKILKSANYNVVSNGFKNSRKKGLWNDEKKIKITNFPILKKTKVPSSISTNDIILTFAGTFLKKVREPNALLNMISLFNNPRLKFVIYAQGNCGTLLRRFVKDHGDKVTYFESVSYEIARKGILHSDILINVDNLNLYQIPSKAYEYISLGKPIINIYNYAEQIKVFEKYPTKINIKSDDINENNISIIEDFCITNYKNIISWDQITKLYRENTPQYVSKIFNEIIKVLD